MVREQTGAGSDHLKEIRPVTLEPNFFNLYNHGFIRVALGIPEVQVADPAFNTARTIELMEQAAGNGAIDGCRARKRARDRAAVREKW